MKIGIIGAGFTGLVAALRLSKTGHQVIVFERESFPGGLAVGFKDPQWDWPLEKHYHHWFVSDKSATGLAAEIGHPVTFSGPKTSVFTNSEIFRLDSPLSLLKFSPLGMIDRLRTAAGLTYLKLNPFWQPLEHVTARAFIENVMGQASWRILWEPLFTGKFSHYSDSISAAWFWARIYKRSLQLGYPEGGFQTFAQAVEQAAVQSGAQFNYSVVVKKIIPLKNGQVEISIGSGDRPIFDKLICTLPVASFLKLAPALPQGYRQKYSSLIGIGAINLVLSLNRTFLKDGTYWLNINDRKFPFLALVEHTNFVSSAHYSNEKLVYIGNYLPPAHRFFSMSERELLNLFFPFLRQINPEFSLRQVKNAWVWKAPFAQPVVTLNFSPMIPPFVTPLPNIYLANIQQVYPWDRGTNYAVELGERVAKICVSKS